MATTRATNALKSYIAQSVAKRETVTFDKMVFAHINGLNDTTLANINSVPTAGQIKHTANIQQTGYIADDQVVYSVTLGSEIGDFTFNFVGLVNSAKNVLGVAIYTGDIVKTRTKAEEQGNALTRNIILQVNNAKTLTNIQTQAKAWQFDFTDKFLQIKPKKITASTTNTADSSGHSHEIDKASTTQAGVVQLVDNWATNDNSKALTASTGKRLYDTLKGLIDTLRTTASNALSKTTPKKITAGTTNTADNNGHTHEIDKASTTLAGVVQLVDNWTTNDNRKALTASTGKRLYDTLKGLIDGVSGRTTTAQNTAANALGRTTARKITASTTNTTDNNGHEHEIDKASTTVAGVVKLNDTLTSNVTNEALTARQGKVLDEKIKNVKVEFEAVKPTFQNLWKGWHGRKESGNSYNVDIVTFDANGQRKTAQFSTRVPLLTVNLAQNAKGIIYVTCIINAGGGNGNTQRNYSFPIGFEGFIGADRYGGENADRNYSNVIYVKQQGNVLHFYCKGGEGYAGITSVDVLKLG